MKFARIAVAVFALLTVAGSVCSGGEAGAPKGPFESVVQKGNTIVAVYSHDEGGCYLYGVEGKNMLIPGETLTIPAGHSVTLYWHMGHTTLKARIKPKPAGMEAETTYRLGVLTEKTATERYFIPAK